MTRNRDRIVNIRPRKLLSLVAINWLHALLHLGFGPPGLTGANQSTSARRYMHQDAGLFAVLTAMGSWRVGGQPRMHRMMSMAIDWAVNVIHAGGTAFGLANTVRDHT